jgi:hypothetical protein
MAFIAAITQSRLQVEGGMLNIAIHTGPPITRFRMISGKRHPSHTKKLVKAFPRSIIELSVILTTKRCLPIPE